MINQDDATMMISKKENIIKRKRENQMFSHSPFENLSSDKYFIYDCCLPNDNSFTYYMHIYESQTLQLNQIIPLVNFFDDDKFVEVSASPSKIMVITARNFSHQVKLKLMEYD